ncbi:hypothetical protein D9Q98_005298 [Chlorella vulgaris]|uniref:Formin-like protein n=1 Tax=Chlorella vulgaris TaxID=3077 RepID=A0A9D4TNU8_CHLVU|nr:hypothetical protein D9Q98_005298 [Chlorella vulgaris]
MSSKENSRSRGYAAALQRKQAAAAASNNDPLPRVAALAPQRFKQSRSPLRASFGVLDRPLSSLKNVPRSSSSMLSGVIGQQAAWMDEEEQALQAELVAADQRLMRLSMHQQQRLAATPMQATSSASPSALFSAVSVQQASSSQPLTPGQMLTPQSRQEQGQQQEQGQEQELSQQGRLFEQEQQQAAAQADEPGTPAIPSSDLSLVRSVTTATGTGCKGVIAPHVAATLAPGACWTSRGHRSLLMESYCILQLKHACTSDVTLRITFADAGSVPRIVRLEHAPTATAAFEPLGDILLAAKSLHQLRHLFRLGKRLQVRRFLRITLLSHMAEEHSGAHRVSHMLLTSGAQPQPTQSASAQSGGQGHSGTSAAALAALPPPGEHTVDSKQREAVTPATVGGHTPPDGSVELAAVAPSSSSEPAVPPLLLAAVLSGMGTAIHVASTAQPAPPPQLPADASSLSTAGPAIAAAPNPELPALVAASQLAAEDGHSAGRPAAPDPENELSRSSYVSGIEEGELEAQEKEGLPRGHQQLQAEVEAAQERTSLQDASSPDAMQEVLPQLPAERRAEVGAFLSDFNLDSQQAQEAVLRLFDGETHSSAAELGEDAVLRLPALLPSAEERQLLGGYQGRHSALGFAEAFMLKMMEVPALHQGLDALRISSGFNRRAEAVAASAALLSAACQEVQQCEVLRTVLKVALLAANFLNAGNPSGTAAGFQLDALPRLKDVRSTRARSRTLLHFVAREAARLHSDSPCLSSALPSAHAAARLDLSQVAAEVQDLAAGVAHVEGLIAAAQDGVTSVESLGTCLAHMTAFRAEALDRLSCVVAQVDTAQEAFRQLGSSINVQRSTMQQPALFFGVLLAFAAELDGAHQENAAADASPGSSTQKKDRKRKQQQQQQQQVEAGSPTACLTSPATSSVSVEALRRRRCSASEHGSPQALDFKAAHRASGHERSVTPPQRRRHSPSPCLSVAAMAGIGGSRRAEEVAFPTGAGERVGPDLLAAADSRQAAGAAEQQQQQQEQQASAGCRLSTPVACLLAESARLISSVEGGFGSALNSDGSGGGADGGGAAAQSDTCVAATPEPAGQEDGKERAEPDRGEGEAYSTPRGAVAQGWQGRQRPAASQACQLPPGGSAAVADQERAQVPAAAVPEAEPGSLSAWGQLSVSQLRQRSLQQLSPTSTPLSSLGRQSSRGSVYSSSASTPGSARRASRGPLLRTNSPLGAPAGVDGAGAGAGAAVVQEGGGRRRAAAVAGLGVEERTAGGTDILPPLDDEDDEAADLPVCAPAAELSHAAVAASTHSHSHPSAGSGGAESTALAEELQRLEQQQWQQAAGAEGLLESSDDEFEGRLPEGDEQEEEDAAHLQACGIVPLHSRAGSFDLTFYAPLSAGQAAHLDVAQQAQLRLSASFDCSELPRADAWGPLAAQRELLQLQASAAQLRISADDLVLPDRPAASLAGGLRRAAVSLPASPRRSAGGRAAGLPPLDFRSMAGRPPLWQQQQQQQQQLSPVLEALLGSVPSPFAPGRAQAAAAGTDRMLLGSVAQPIFGGLEVESEDLVDLTDYCSDHEAQQRREEELWQQQQLSAEWEQRQAAGSGVVARQSLEGTRLASWASQELLFISRDELASLQDKYPAAGDNNQEAEQPLLLDARHQRPQQQQQGQQGVAQEQLAAVLPRQKQQQGINSEVSHWQEEEEAQGVREQGRRGDGCLVEEESEEMASGQVPLPSPITAATSNLDAAVARLLACTGNTTAGPLALGAHGGGYGGERRQGSAAAGAGGQPMQEVALLEPIMPGPMAEGIRASHAMAQHVPAAALRQSLEWQRGELQGARSAPAAALEAEAPACAGRQARAAEGGAGQQREGDMAASEVGSGRSGWGGERRRGALGGLKKMLGKHY